MHEIVLKCHHCSEDRLISVCYGRRFKQAFPIVCKCGKLIWITAHTINEEVKALDIINPPEQRDTSWVNSWGPKIE